MKKHLFTIFAFVLGLILNAQVCLNPTAGSPFSLAQQPFAITSADFNGDGKADVASADRNNSTVSVLLGDGLGSFTTTTSFTVGSFPNSITNADFNADGKIDLATTNNGSSNVSILLGDGAGNFTVTTSISVGSAPFSITKGDFNLDGKIDLAVANNSSNDISILLGNGLGSFAPAVSYTAGNGPISVITADFNNDSKLDLGIANYIDNNVSVLTGNGLGNFSAAVNFSVGTYPRSIINADFNSDGIIDLATANDGSNDVSVMLGNGAGSFASSTIFSVGTNPNSVISADFNADGKADLATANINSNNLSVLLGNGSGSFGTAVNLNVGSAARSVISGDFNGDTRDDLASANFISLSIFLNETPSVTANATSTVVCAGTTVSLTGGGAATYSWSGGVFNGVPFIPSSTSAYTVTGTDGNGCTNTAVKTIIVNPVPNVNAGFDQSLTCASTSVTLNGSVTSPTNAIINWTGLNICGAANTVSTSACAAGFYTLTVTDPVNGCVSSDIVEVFNNAVAPNVIASVSNTLTCSNITANIVATTTTNPVSNNWTGPGILSGANTPTINVNQSGIYNLVVTDLINGCTTNTFVNVFQDITIPSISVTASSSVICAGTSLTMNASGANTYSWAPGGQTTNSIIVSPTNTTNYTITGIGLNGCTNSINQNISVNALPIISINGNTNICKGSSSLLSASGAVSYTWNSGATTNSISVTPTLSTSYDVTGEDGNGCLNTSSLTVNIISSKNISGIITSTAGAVNGDVILYKYTLGLSLWDSVTTVPFTNSYTFNNIDSALYVVRALPTATNIQVTYGSSSTSWQNATVISHGCSTNTNQNITLIDLATFTPGPGILSGTITEASGFGQRMTDTNKPLVPGNPIGGIIVKGGKNPGGQMFVQTTTALDGTYTLTGLPLNSATDGYFIFVDMPGLDTNGTYHVVLNSGNTQINNLNFTVDSVYINPIGSITSISNSSYVLDNKIIVFPNPAKDHLSIHYTLQTNSIVQIELLDILGKSVKVLLPATQQNTDIQKKSWQINDLSTGLYFIKISINGYESTIKLSVTK